MVQTASSSIDKLTEASEREDVVYEPKIANTSINSSMRNSSMSGATASTAELSDKNNSNKVTPLQEGAYPLVRKSIAQSGTTVVPENRFPDLPSGLIVSASLLLGIGLLQLLPQWLEEASIVTASQADQIIMVLPYITGIAGLIAAIMVGIKLWGRAYDDLVAKQITIEFCLGAALAVFCGLTVYGLISATPDFINRTFFDSLLAFAFGVSALDVFCRYSRRRLKRFQGFHLAELCRWARPFGREGALGIGGQQVESSRMTYGDRFIVRAGDRIPLDGQVLEGTAEVLERRFSGSPTSVLRDLGDFVYAGSEVVNGELVCSVTNLSVDSELSLTSYHLDEIMAQPITSDFRFHAVEQAVSLGVVFGSLFGGFVSFAWTKSVYHAICSEICILLLLFIPISVALRFPLRRIVLTKLFSLGALVRSAEVLERLRTIKSFVVEFSPSLMKDQVIVDEVEILDESVSKDTSIGILVRLLAKSTSSFYRGIARQLRGMLKRMPAHAVNDIRMYPAESGVSGTVEGCELTFGNEELLIERGVLIQAGDVLGRSTDGAAKEGVEHLLLAAGDTVIARVAVRRDKGIKLTGLPDFLRDIPVKAQLWGEAKGRDVDEIGKKMGFELPDISGGLAGTELGQKLAASVDTALFSERSRWSSVPNVVSYSTFDELVREVDRTDVTLFRLKPETVFASLKLPRMAENLANGFLFAGIILSALLYIFSLSTYASPGMVLGILILYVISAQGALHGFARRQV